MIAPSVLHQPEKSRFVIVVQPQELDHPLEAVLEYRLAKGAGAAPAAVDFTRTYVPPSLRAQGLAEALVRRGLAWAKEQGYRIEASCWYVAKFLR